MKFQKVLLGHVYVGTNLSSCQFRSPQSKAEGYYYFFLCFYGRSITKKFTKPIKNEISKSSLRTCICRY